MPANSNVGSLVKGHELQDDVNFINELLRKFGLDEFPFNSLFPQNEEKFRDMTTLHNQAVVCSILIQLLQSKQREDVFRNDSEERIVRLMDEIRSSEVSHRRQEDRIVLQDRELVGHRQNHQLTLEKQRHLESSVSALKDELTKFKQVSLQKERQFQHEIRKREKEFEKLKDQLAAVLKDMVLREQKSEIQYVQSARETETVLKSAAVESEQELLMEPATSSSRFDIIESENYRLRQLSSYFFGSFVQLSLDLFPELEIDQSILSLVEASPIEWIDETMSQRFEELMALIRENVMNFAGHGVNEIRKESEAEISRLTAQFQAATTTISSQRETIRTLETKILKMEEYRSRVEALETEKAGFQELMKSNAVQKQFVPHLEQSEGDISELPSTPKWMKTQSRA